MTGPLPTQPELYAYPNGHLQIRVPDGNKHKGYFAIKLGTGNVEKGRHEFAKWLKKNKIADIDAASAPIMSRWGALDPNLGLYAQLTKLRSTPPKPLIAAKANGHAPETEDLKAEKKREYNRRYNAKRKNGGGDLDRQRLADLAQICAANLASAATTLRMINEALGTPSDDD